VQGPLKRILPLRDMDTRHPGLQGGLGAAYFYAACVCLDRHHEPPVDFRLRDVDQNESVEVEWDVADDLTRGSWANEIDATEAAGYAIVIASVELARGLLAVRRAEGTTGADYYIAPPGTDLDDLEDCVRLEVSASDRLQSRELERLLSRKVSQTRVGRSNLPAMAGVVGFKEQLILLGGVEGQV
jgi:hypothetical protein